MNQVNWTEADVFALGNFLNSNPKVLQMLSDKEPSLRATASDTIDGMALMGARAGGYREAINDLKKLATLDSAQTQSDDI